MKKKQIQKNSSSAASTASQQPKPVRGKPFKKGESGNPKGRIPGSKNFTTAVREAMQAVAEGTASTYQELIVKRVMQMAIGGDSAMIKLVWEQLDGRPAQKVSASFTGTVTHTTVQSSKAKAVVKKFNAELRAALNNDEDDE